MQCSVDMAAVAHAYVYFEKLVLMVSHVNNYYIVRASESVRL